MSQSTDNTFVTARYQNGDYLEKNSSWHVEDSPWKASQIEKIIGRNELTLNSFCEIGCGAGEILRQLSLKPQFQGVPFYGYEVSEVAYELCKTRETEKVKFYLDDLLNKDVFYVMLLCIDVFELVQDYLGFLRQLHTKATYKTFHIPLELSVNALLRGAMLKGRESVGHLHYFTPDTAIATLKDCGYEIIDVMYTPSFADFPSTTFNSKLARFPRKLLFRISPHLMSTLLGGASLMVLTR